MEQMLAVSMLNMQLDMLSKHLSAQEIPIKNNNDSKILSCLGFSLDHPELKFYNKYLTVTSAYNLVEASEECDEIEEKFKQGFLSQFAGLEGEFGKQTFKELVAQRAAKAREEMAEKGMGQGGMGQGGRPKMPNGLPKMPNRKKARKPASKPTFPKDDL